MGKFLYTLYAMAVIAVMGNASYTPPSPSSGSSNPNSYYHGGSAGGGGSYGGHK